MRTITILRVLIVLTLSPALGEGGEQIPGITTTVQADTGVVSVTHDSVAQTMAFAAAQAVTTNFTMPPSVTTSQRRQALSRQNFVYLCVDANNQPLTCSITLSHQAVPNSGGHVHHDGDRPKGTFTATSGNTNGSTGFSTIFTAPEPGGVISLNVTLVFPPVPPAVVGQTVAFTQTIGVEISGLQTLPPGNWLPIGARPGKHTDNHYGLAGMNESVLLLADEYRQAFGALLAINDLSLVQGGLYDVYDDDPDTPPTVWLPPHASHRFGDDVDVRLPPRERRLRLLRMAEYFQLRRVVERGVLDHYHFRLVQ